MYLTIIAFLVTVYAFSFSHSFSLQVISFIALAVLATYRIFFVQEKYTQKNMKRIDSMAGPEFEACVCSFFKSKGYVANVTLASNDFGADVIIKKHGIKTAIQCKRYKGKVGISAVQEIVSAKAYYHAQQVMVVTNSYFTEAAKKLAEANHVVLCDREWCKKYL